MNIDSVAIRYVHNVKIGTLQCVLLVPIALYEREREMLLYIYQETCWYINIHVTHTVSRDMNVSETCN